MKKLTLALFTVFSFHANAITLTLHAGIEIPHRNFCQLDDCADVVQDIPFDVPGLECKLGPEDDAERWFPNYTLTEDKKFNLHHYHPMRGKNWAKFYFTGYNGHVPFHVSCYGGPEMNLTAGEAEELLREVDHPDFSFQ